MDADSWHNILTLMTIVILADKRVYKEEVDTFVDAAISLNETISPDMFLTPKMAFDWFVANRKDINKKLADPDSSLMVEMLVTSLQKIGNKRQILRAMQAIAHADNDFHKSEQSIIKIASRNWGIAAT